MRVLLDTDVVLDVILGCEPFAKEAAEILDLSEQGAFDAYVSAITPLNVFYVARKARTKADLRQAVHGLLQTVCVCTIDESVLANAFTLSFQDYEDAVQHCCATANNLEGIVTRNLKDYKNATLPVFSPADFLRKLESQQT